MDGYIAPYSSPPQNITTAMAEKGNGMEMKKVFICSPLKPVSDDKEKHAEEFKENLRVARAASLYALMDCAMPMAPQLYFPQVLDDNEPEQREFGMTLGLEWLSECDELWVIGRRVSEGMIKEITMARKMDIPVRHYVFRRTPQERLQDAIKYPNIDFREMIF